MKKKWVIVEGRTLNEKIEYQVSDGEPLERTHSYDFTDFSTAKEFCDKLNRGEE